MDTKYGVVTEQGDLGLGFSPMTEEERKKIEENSKKSQDKEEHDK